MSNEELRRLLELAAKAAGLTLQWANLWGKSIAWADCSHGGSPWNPADDDGDSRRLEVTLGIKVMPYPIYTFPKHSVIASRRILSATGADEHTYIGPEVIELYGDDPRAATRLAVLRAAAAIGEEMP